MSMTWQPLLAFYLALATASFLLRRKLGSTAPKYNRFINWFFFLGVLYPIGIMIALWLHQSLRISPRDLLVVAVAEMVFPLINLAQYRASKDVDAGLLTIINNIAPIITISTAWLLLREGLDSREFVGAIVIIASTFIISLPGLFNRSRSKVAGLLFALLSVLMLGVATTFERWMLTRVSFSAYLVYGWGFQTFWMTVIAWPQRKRVTVLKDSKLRKLIIAFGLVNACKGLCWLGALRLSGNASLVSTFGSFTAVLVVLAAYVVLKERQYIVIKIVAAVMGAIGLIVLNG